MAKQIKKPDTENPYLAARREWNERYGSYIARARSWRIIAVLSMLTALIAVLGVIYIGSQNKLVPYIVEVDKLGHAVAVQRASVAANPDTRIVKAQLASFIQSSRSIYADAAAQNNMVKITYSMLRNNQPSYKKMNSFFQQNNPFQRAETETTSVEIQSMLPMSDKTWRAEWVETKFDRAGAVIAKDNMQAILTVSVNPPQDEALLLINPMGVYVDDFNWSANL